jgi:excisionase family DNA binding protein
MAKNEKEVNVPIWLKVNLTIEEAAAYTGVGVNKLRELSDSDSCDFVLWIGRKRLLKRQKLEEYLENAFSI